LSVVALAKACIVERRPKVTLSYLCHITQGGHNTILVLASFTRFIGVFAANFASGNDPL
jgi:hypothetical protein